MNAICPDLPTDAPCFSRPALTDEQQAAFDGVMERRGIGLDSGVDGSAGTGKTTLGAALMEALPEAVPVAPTGRAALNLGSKVGRAASTIHRLIYRPVTFKNDDGEEILRFVPRYEEPGALCGTDLILDERSMASEAMAADLKRTGARIISLGDSFQLQPVGGNPGFPDADFRLETVHRQALQSGVLRQALRVRAGKPYQTDGGDFQVGDSLNERLLAGADMLLCYKNTTRHAINDRLRAILGKSSHPRAGEPVLCLKNAIDYGISNGGVYILARDFRSRDRDIALLIDGEARVVPDVVFAGVERPPPKKGKKGKFDPIVSEFDFGYCLTVHKSQGSEWDNVLIIDEYTGWEHRQNWLYTAITRAARRVIIIKGFKP